MSEDFSTLDESDDHNLYERLADIIKNASVSTVFQPIISLRDGSIMGYEALTRGPINSDLRSPALLFSVAEKHNMLWELELLCRSKALEAFYNKKTDFKLFLNVNPNIMNDIKFRHGFTKEYLKEFSIDPKSIIFEITERNAVSNINVFKKTVEHYKEQNYKIAIDDAGGGYSGLNLISDIHPHYIKLDMNLIRDIDADSMKQALVRGMYEFSKLSNIQLIAEGIESEKELSTLIEIGVQYGQGFLIQEPDALIYDTSDKILNFIIDCNNKKNHLYGYKISNIYINSITEKTMTINPNISISQAEDILHANPRLPGFCVTSGDVVVGVVTKDIIHSKLSGRYGYSLNAEKPISAIMNRNFLSVDQKTAIDAVATLAMSRTNETLYDFITVTKNSKYLGIVTVKNIIEKTIEIEIVNAKHLNPLSELPGNVLIEQCLEACINSLKPYCVLYIDIDNFKAYNDVYGFENGDRVLKLLTQIITSIVPPTEFVGHIGGDDFIAVLTNSDPETICKAIITDFDETVLRYYNEKDVKEGFIIAKNRHGVEECFPLIKLSIACLTTKKRKFETIYALSEEASKVKSKCKQIKKSSYIILE